jgi:IS30 family transposase
MPYYHCTSTDRDKLQLFRAEGKSISDIAELLHKHMSTLYRELSRNHFQGDYISGKAHAMVQKRRFVTKPCPKRENEETMKIVHARLVDKQSPEQISGRLSLDFPTEPNKQVSTETIYQYAYDSIRNGDTKLRHSLRHSHSKRRKRLTGKDKRGIIPNRTMIDQRPAEVDTKQTYGHWEGDTVEGAGKAGYLATFVERKMKILLAYPIPNKTTKCLNHAAEVLFRRIPAVFKKSLTVDNGKEFAQHLILANKIHMAVFFAHPYHSWERGLNEHTNGLLRQYFPKCRDLRNLNPRKLAKAVEAINNRPRKCLGYRTPNEVFRDQKFALQI